VIDRQTQIHGRLERASLGVPLSRLIAQPPTPHVLRAFAHACRQIDRAHACGVVHRDLRPEHIIVGRHEVWVGGWERARLDDEDEATLPHVANPYAAPERPADARGDVYALGCILFELLAGEPMHARPGPLDAAARSPSLRRPERARELALDSVCAAATAPDPAHRVQTAGELADRVLAGIAGHADMRGLARAVLPAYVLSMLFVPLFLWFASGERVLAIVLTGLVAAAAGLLVLQWRGGRWRPLLFATLNVTLVVMAGRIASLLCAPSVAAIVVAGMAFGPSYARGKRLALLAIALCLAILVPFAAERAGWLASTVTPITDGYTIVAPVFHMRPEGLIVGFVGYAITLIAASALLVHALVRRERES
jgi:hypothetical protein